MLRTLSCLLYGVVMTTSKGNFKGIDGHTHGCSPLSHFFHKQNLCITIAFLVRFGAFFKALFWMMKRSKNRKTVKPKMLFISSQGYEIGWCVLHFLLEAGSKPWVCPGSSMLCVKSSVVGVWLCRRARRGRELPEWEFWGCLQQSCPRVS